MPGREGTTPKGPPAPVLSTCTVPVWPSWVTEQAAGLRCGDPRRDIQSRPAGPSLAEFKGSP